jgi:hypothetical protein
MIEHVLRVHDVVHGDQVVLKTAMRREIRRKARTCSVTMPDRTRRSSCI